MHWCRRRVRFNEVPKVPEKVCDPLVQSQVRPNRAPEKVPEKVWEALVQSQVRFNRICVHLIQGNPPKAFPALGFAPRFRKICKNKTLQLLGIPPKLFFNDGYWWIWLSDMISHVISFMMLYDIICHIFHMLWFHIVVYDGSGPLINIDQHRTPPRSSEAWKSSGDPTWRRRPCDNFWACSSWRKRRALCAGGCRSMMKYRGWVMVGICWDWLDYVWLQRETQGPVKKTF